jgi:hypothetical protein
MKRVLLTVAVALLIPGLLGAQTPVTMGIYANGKLHYTPSGPFTPFQLHLYIVQSEYFVTAVEYQLVVPDGRFVVTGVSYPANFSIELGDPVTGHSITFWPPMTGYPDGYDRLATYECLIIDPMGCDGMPDYPLAIGPHPVSGELRGTYSPDNNTFPIVGLTTFLCPTEGVASDDESWGAIKSLYR